MKSKDMMWGIAVLLPFGVAPSEAQAIYARDILKQQIQMDETDPVSGDKHHLTLDELQEKMIKLIQVAGFPAKIVQAMAEKKWP